MRWPSYLLEFAMGLAFEWDPRKAAVNEKKHGVAFKEATTVFGDLWHGFNRTRRTPSPKFDTCRWDALR